MSRPNQADQSIDQPALPALMQGAAARPLAARAAPAGRSTDQPDSAATSLPLPIDGFRLGRQSAARPARYARISSFRLNLRKIRR